MSSDINSLACRPPAYTVGIAPRHISRVLAVVVPQGATRIRTYNHCNIHKIKEKKLKQVTQTNTILYNTTQHSIHSMRKKEILGVGFKKRWYQRGLQLKTAGPQLRTNKTSRNLCGQIKWDVYFADKCAGAESYSQLGFVLL